MPDWSRMCPLFSAILFVPSTWNSNLSAVLTRTWFHGQIIGMSGGFEFELSKENASDLAVEHLKEDFWWDCVDETAPFGNDTGSDTLSEYWKWRPLHEAMSSIDFLPRLLRGWEVTNSHRDLVDEESVQKSLSKDGFSVMTHDEAIIALYFAEIIVDGRRDPHVHPHALKAIERQMLQVCIRLYADHAQEERLARLKRMREVLLSLE